MKAAYLTIPKSLFLGQSVLKKLGKNHPHYGIGPQILSQFVRIVYTTLLHRRQEPFLVARKTYTKPSTFVKYVIKLMGAANPIADSKFVEEYVMNNKANQIF